MRSSFHPVSVYQVHRTPASINMASPSPPDLEIGTYRGPDLLETVRAQANVAASPPSSSELHYEAPARQGANQPYPY